MAEIETAPVTIAEEPTVEPAEVDVEPVDAEPVHAEPVDAEPVEPVVAPKKRGRPTGSKSKEPGKPRAPRKAKVVQMQEPEEDEIPERILPGSLPIPTHAYDDRSAMMLELLQLQAQDRRNRKQALYRSWFR